MEWEPILNEFVKGTDEKKREKETIKISESVRSLHEKNPKQVLNVTAYCRVSTDYEEQQSSYHQQQSYYKEYITSHPGWNFIGIYADEGISGTSMKKRREFSRMIKDAVAGKIDYILVKSISRFARNTVDTLSSIRLLKNLTPPVGVYFEKENIDTLDSRGELILTIMSALAQDESRSISDNIKWTFQKKFQAGEDVTNLNNMLGYDWDENRKWVINEEQAKTVRYIFQSYLEGKGTDTIAAELTRQKCRTGRGKAVWRGGAVYRILTNEKYVGDSHLQKTVVRDLFSHQSVRNDGSVPSYYIRDHHVPIIDRKTWDAVQLELKRRREMTAASSQVKAKYSSKWPFSSKLQCGTCGEMLIRRTFRAKDFRYPVWRCANAERYQKGSCREKSYLELALKQSFMEYVYTLRQEREEELRRMFQEGMEEEEQNGNASDMLKQLEQLDQAISELERKRKENEELLKSADPEMEPAYQAMITGFTGQIARKKKERQNFLWHRPEKEERKAAFEWFLARLHQLPAESPAGAAVQLAAGSPAGNAVQPSVVNSSGDKVSVFDILPFDEQMFVGSVIRATVIGDGRIIYETRFGIPFLTSGNDRRFRDFLGWRYFESDGTACVIRDGQDAARAGEGWRILE